MVHTLIGLSWLWWLLSAAAAVLYVSGVAAQEHSAVWSRRLEPRRLRALLWACYPVFFLALMTSGAHTYVAEEWGVTSERRLGSPVAALIVGLLLIAGVFLLGAAVLQLLDRAARGAHRRSSVTPSASRSRSPDKHICCVCLEDRTGEPVIRDSMTGNVFCREHSYCFDEMQRGLNTKHCPSCGFGYYASYGSYVKGYQEGHEIRCPRCDACLRKRIG